MSWVNPKTWITNELVTAAMLNTELRDRLLDIWKVTTKGDILAAKSANELARQAAGSNGQVITYDSNEATGMRAANIMPIGGIILWSGSVVNIPAGWHLCDGTSGTPDLRNRFVIGAGSTYAVGDTGGATTKNLEHTHTQGNTGAEASHTHTQGNTGSEASHTHGVSGTTGTGSHFSMSVGTGSPVEVAGEGHVHPYSGDSGAGSSHAHSNPTTAAGSSHSHTNPTTASGGSTTQDIMPPYYALCYIMRTS